MAKIREPHALAGKTVLVKGGEFDGKEYHIEDWWQNVAGKSWMFCDGNPACLEFAMRSGFESLPPDNEVVYGKIGAMGKLMHVSQLGDPIVTN